MRLHSLQVTAFGPFADTQVVDFDALGADGLFLLHGVTGAGKTTVLDAVAFALFGELPGARGDADGRRLLSDHAAAGAVPRVELELTVGGTRLRLVRSPEHQRPKRRGTGSTTEQAKASLTWLDRPEVDGVTRIPEVAAEVQRLIGMSAEQFFQVVLLPQGEFARFLRASTEERARLLARLFDTGRFRSAESWLAGRRRDTAAAAAVGTQQVEVLLGQLCTAAGGDSAPPAVSHALHWAQHLLAEAAAETQRCAGRLATTREQVSTARAAETAAAQALQLVGRQERARQQLTVLAEQEPRRAEQARAVRAARAAAPVITAARDAAQCAEDAAGHRSVVADLTSRLAMDDDGCAVVAVPGGTDGDRALAAACDGWREEIGRLKELVELSQAVVAEQARAGLLHTRVGVLRDQLGQLVERREELPAQQAQAEAALTLARRAADSVDALARDVARARTVLTASAEVPVHRAAYEAAQAAHTAAVTAHQAATARWLDLRESRLAGMAAELAGALHSGQACTVCGAVEHPRPAQPGEYAVSDRDEQQARAAAHDAGQVVQDCAAEVAATLRELDHALHRSTGLDAHGAEVALAEASAAHQQAGALAATVAPCERRCADLTAAGQQVQQQQQELHAELAAAEAEAAQLRRSLAHAQDRLREARGPDPDVTARRRRLQALAVDAAVLLTARAQARTAEQTAAHRHEQATLLARDAGFTGVDQACAAELGATELASSEAELEQARHAEAAARAVLAEPEVAALGGLDTATGQAAWDCAVQACAVAEAALGHAQGASATAQHRVQTVQRLITALQGHLDALLPLLAEAERVAALADVVAGLGQNARKVSLHSYVLAARLEQVAVAATQRLLRMSGGRYEFVHSDAVGPHGRRGGLGLDVLDAHTGVVRSTKTLSGGESFLASLSLALGLADVVAEESGGVQLDTLFIDEGFGTLDSAALEQVMGVLDELRAGGRVVGLVSHVDELRQRIPNRLHVRATRFGSHLQATAG